MAEREKETLQAFDDLKTLGDLEYRVDLEPYMDPIARYGYDVETWNPSRAGGSHFNPFDDTVNIQSSHLGSKAVDAHEFRHRGFQQLFYKYGKNPDFYEKKYPGIGNFLKAIISNSRDKDLNERITEFYDKPETWNTPVQYFNENNVLHKGRHYEEDPYEVSNVEHGEMPVYGSGFDVRKYRGKSSVEDTLDFDSEAGLRKRQKFNEYRDQPAEERGGNIFFDNVLQVEQMADDLYKEERGFAQGGPVMQGIGTLNETARNMFRGPSGVGAYQQFASGGEANRELEDLFNDKSQKEIPLARGLPPMENLFGDGIRNFEEGRGRGYFDDVNFKIDSYEIDGKPSYAIEFDDGFSLFEPQIIEMMDENNSANEPIPGERTRKELFRYLFEKNPTSEEFFRYLKTTGLASGGEVSGPPPTRGPDPQGIGAFQKFADGGPVYMQEGGTGRDALASNHFDLIKEKYPNVDPLKISQEEGLPPQLISVFQRLLFQENQSADAGAVGTSGEIGLAQLMPVTAKDVGVNRDNLTDNVRGGARYLFKMYNRFDQDPMKAVAAYNAGPTAVVDNLDRNDGQLNIGQLPSTTQSYLGFVVQPVLNQTEVAQTIDPMMAGEDLAMSMPVAQSDYLSPEAQENIRQGTQFQGGPPTGDLSIGEQIRREKFKPNVSFEGQEMEAMPVDLLDKYSSKNMQEQLVSGQEPLDKGIAGVTRSLRPPFRPEEGLTRSLRPPFRPKEGLTRSLRPPLRPEPVQPYGGSNPQGLMDGIESLRDRTFRRGFTPYAEDVRGELI